MPEQFDNISKDLFSLYDQYTFALTPKSLSLGSWICHIVSFEFKPASKLNFRIFHIFVRDTLACFNYKFRLSAGWPAVETSICKELKHFLFMTINSPAILPKRFTLNEFHKFGETSLFVIIMFCYVSAKKDLNCITFLPKL